MAANNKGSVVARVTEIAQPIAQRLGLSIWDIEFVKEGASWFLRIYIDKPEGISVDDCETFSRAIDGPLDEADPIDQNYYLEVSSPGIERELKKDWHFESQLGSRIRIRLIRPLESGEKELEGTLDGYESGVILLTTDTGRLEIKRSETSHVRLCDLEDGFGGIE